MAGDAFLPGSLVRKRVEDTENLDFNAVKQKNGRVDIVFLLAPTDMVLPARQIEKADLQTIKFL